jgi:ubiquinone/menaquinone biosynthesis C-methylase UbiE
MLRLLTPDRIYEEELLDAGDGTDDDVLDNLTDLRRINRYLGGARAIVRTLSPRIKTDTTKAWSLLDVGIGSADIPLAVADQFRSRGVELSITGVDLSERILRLLREKLNVNTRMTLVRGDALSLPFANNSFDFVTASLFLHHFREDDAVRLLREFSRVARRAVIINDLVRDLVPYYFTRLTGPLLAKSYLTRNDAPVSVLRGFTSKELNRLALKAGLSDFKIRRFFPYRLVLTAETGER